MEFYNLRIENKRYRNISAMRAAGIIAKWGPYIKERYNVNPMRICADIIHHADAVRMAWYDDNEKVFLSINKGGK
jgi:hypothetical protein